MENSNYPQSSITPLDSISIGNAIAWTGNWQKLFPNHCKAFLIPITDTLNLLEELQILKKNENGDYENILAEGVNMGIRAYMAIGDSDKDGDVEERLVMVGAVEDENGVYVDQIAKRKDGENVTLSGSGAFDVTRPCPNECDPGSSLFQ